MLNPKRRITAVATALILLTSAPAIGAAAAAAGAQPPRASLQELMQAVVDPAADGLWDAVETTVTREGEQTRSPKNAEEWAGVWRRLIVLRESASLLRVSGRPVARRKFAAEAQGALDSNQIAERIRGDRPYFDAFALALGITAQRALDAVAKRDLDAMVRIGGDLDAVCESCHLHFWYPNQVIPPLP